MNPAEQVQSSQESTEQKLPYEAPRLTTFGSVSELTMGSLSRSFDFANGTLTRRHRR